MKPQLKKTLIDRLPPTFLDTVCHGTTIIIDDSIIEKGYEEAELKSKNYILENGQGANLITLENIARLERKYRIDNAKTLSAIQKEILNTPEEVSNWDINDFQRTIKLKNYILEKILPSFGISDSSLVKQVNMVLNNRKDLMNQDIKEPNKTTFTEDTSYEYDSKGDDFVFKIHTNSKRKILSKRI